MHWKTYLLLLFSICVIVPALTAQNLLSNPGFDTKIKKGLIICSQVPDSTRNWQPYSQPNSRILPKREDLTKRFGDWALEVYTLPAPQGCGGGGAYQDLSTLPANTSYTFSYWALPLLGEEEQDVFFQWDHSEHAVGVTRLTISEDCTDPERCTELVAWGMSATGPKIEYKKWHPFKISVDAVKRTATLRVNGLPLITTLPGSPLENLPVTVYLGQGHGAPTAEDHFFYDMVTLDATPHPKKASPAAVTRGVDHQKIRLAGSNFSPGSIVKVSGTGVTVTSVRERSARNAIIFVDVDPSAAVGPRDVIMTTAGGTDMCLGCLTVQ